MFATNIPVIDDVVYVSYTYKSIATDGSVVIKGDDEISLAMIFVCKASIECSEKSYIVCGSEIKDRLFLNHASNHFSSQTEQSENKLIYCSPVERNQLNMKNLYCDDVPSSWNTR